MVTLRTARAGLPLSLTSWSFIFSVATGGIGLSALAAHAGSVALEVMVATKTFSGSVIQSNLFVKIQPSPAR